MLTSSPGPTPAPSHVHRLSKRYHYTCPSSTFPWEPEWFTESFYTVSSSSYDAVATLGPVQPPDTILQGARGCSAGGAGPLTGTGSATVGGGSSIGAGPNSARTTIQTTIGPQTTYTFTVGRSTFILPNPTASSALSPATSDTASTSSAQRSWTSTPLPESSTTMPSQPSITSFSATTSPPVSLASGPASLNACAGEADFQAWGAVAASLFAVLVGGLLWLSWAALRRRIPSIYSPRSYAVPGEFRPSAPFAVLTFFFPFLPGASPSGSNASFASSVTLACLKLLVLSSVVALGAALPLFAANVPCLADTSPFNLRGGRLGTLTDLSILRLLNALDPSPDVPSRGGSIQRRLLTAAANARQDAYWLWPQARALPQTIAPAISSARIRLIIVLVLVGLLSLVGGLWIVARTYSVLYARKAAFERDTCGGLDMVVIASKDAPGWIGLSEEKVRKVLADSSGTSGLHGEDNREMEIVGVFAVPETGALRQAVAEREVALLALERSEAEYLSSSIRRPGTMPLGPHFVHPKDLGSASSDPAATPIIPGLSRASLPPVKPSRFREVNRNSLQSSFVQFEIGQRIKVTEEGKFVPDPSPESEEGRRLGEGHDRGDPHSASPSSSSTVTTPDGAPLIEAPRSTPPIPEQEASEIDLNRVSSGPRYSAGPSRLPEIHPSPPIRSSRPSAATSPASHPSAAVENARLKLQQMNERFAGLQAAAVQDATSGTEVLGWVIVGRHARYLPLARRIEGMTLEDIVWRNVGGETSERVFWAQIALLGAVLSLLLVPVVGLTNASAPGFAYNLPFLKSIDRSDSFESGLVQGFIPGLIMSSLVVAAVGGSMCLAHRLRTISRHRRGDLATKAVFWMLLWLCIVWAVLVSVLEFAVAGFGSDPRKSRIVADGAIYFTWWLFIFLLNAAIIVPALILLRPVHLWRFLRRRRKAVTPRERYRASPPGAFRPALMLAGPLLAVLYTLSLSMIFPLICIPLFVLLYLSYVVLRHMSSHIFIDRAFSDGRLCLWLVRRLGWALGIQPTLYGLILLSRHEWVIGGISCAIAILAVGLAEILTARRPPDHKRSDLSANAKRRLNTIAASMRKSRTGDTRPAVHQRATSDSSMLRRLTTLLPGYNARLPRDCPLPLRTERVDDTFRTELASITRPDLVDSGGVHDEGKSAFFHDPTERNRGLVYPPEMLAPPPVVWLPYDSEGRAEAEVADLEGRWGLMAVVDPPPK